MQIQFAKHVDEGKPVREGEAASLARAIVSTFALTITNPAPLIGFAALFAGAGSLASQMVTFLDTAIVIAGVLSWIGNVVVSAVDGCWVSRSTRA